MAKERIMVQIMDLEDGTTYTVPKAWLAWSKRCERAFGRCSDGEWWDLMYEMPEDYPKDEGTTEKLHWLIMEQENYKVLS